MACEITITGDEAINWIVSKFGNSIERVQRLSQRAMIIVLTNLDDSLIDVMVMCDGFEMHIRPDMATFSRRPTFAVRCERNGVEFAAYGATAINVAVGMVDLWLQCVADKDQGLVTATMVLQTLGCTHEVLKRD